MRSLSIFSDILQESNICGSHGLDMVCFSSIEEGLKVFQIYSFADTSWADDKKLSQEYLLLPCIRA
jgi:hypothetical protein